MSLFPVDPPPGFKYFPDFITVQEEAYLIHEIRKIDLHPFLFQGFEAKRKTESFGFDYSFDNRKLSKGKTIPSAFIKIIEKIALKTGKAPEDFAELLLIEYPPGSVINWHRDAPPFDLIAGISLLAPCTFRLRPYTAEKRTRGSIIDFLVAPRSLYLISDEARTNWQHSISPVKETRYSLTLRTLKNK
jgi:alkylated DNA repair dioxygenase AlkB